MKNHKIIGDIGEKYAQDFLKENGYQIIETNFRCKMGEADIIASKDGELSFIEVKTRGQEIYGSPCEAVNDKKQNHIYKVAQFYLFWNRIEDIPISLDVMEVYFLDHEHPRIAHMKNAILERPVVHRNRERYEN